MTLPSDREAELEAAIRRYGHMPFTEKTPHRELVSEANKLHGYRDALLRLLTAERAKSEELRAALAEYGCHRAGCGLVLHRSECTCGLRFTLSSSPSPTPDDTGALLLDATEWASFVEFMKNPPAPTPAMREAVKLYREWQIAQPPAPSPTPPLSVGDPASPSRDRASHGAADGVSTLRASPAIAGLEHVIINLHWMARRYADGRQTYAPGLFNDCTRSLLQMGIELKGGADGTIWARNSLGRQYDDLTDEEAAQGIVTQRDETRSGSVERSEIEPGPKDAPKDSGSPTPLQEAVRDTGIQAFYVGQRVRVSERSQFWHDWKDARLEIASVERRRPGPILYGTYDLDNPSEGMTTDWREDDLSRLSQSDAEGKRPLAGYGYSFARDED
jgi:hypothetical protein